MIHNLLNDKKVVLASSSPRRLELFKMIGLQPLVIPAKIEETINGEKPYIQVMHNAKNKASTIAALIRIHLISHLELNWVVVEGRKAYTQRKKGKNKSPTNLQMSLF